MMQIITYIYTYVHRCSLKIRVHSVWNITILSRSTPDLHKLSSSTPNYSVHTRIPTKRTDSTSSLPASGTYTGKNNRYSVIVSTL